MIIKLPLKTYARYTYAPDAAAGYCKLDVDIAGCMLGAPFATAAFFVADDDTKEIAFTQGGISEQRSGVNESAVITSVP